MQTKIMQIVSKICNTSSTNCRSLNKSELARQLLNLANVPQNAEIQEIPLDWGNQVVILFLVPNDANYYSLFAGIGNDGNFYFELTITGILNGNEFDFFDEEKPLDINYFAPKKFEEGKIYQISDWFTGGIHCYQCISRTETTVTFSAIYHKADGDHEIEPKTFDILTENRNEYILFYEYHGHENRMYA